MLKRVVDNFFLGVLYRKENICLDYHVFIVDVFCFLQGSCTGKFCAAAGRGATRNNTSPPRHPTPDYRLHGEKWGEVGRSEEKWGEVRSEEKWEVRRSEEKWGVRSEEKWEVRRNEEKWGEVRRNEDILLLEGKPLGALHSYFNIQHSTPDSRLHEEKWREMMWSVEK